MDKGAMELGRIREDEGTWSWAEPVATKEPMSRVGSAMTKGPKS